MITEFLSFVATSLALGLAFTLARKAITSRIILSRFEKKLKATPVIWEDIGWLGSHENSWQLGANNNVRMQQLHQKHGPYVAGLFCVPVVSTTDLDFIKRVAVDSAMKNIDRLSVQMAIEEFSKDCLLFVGGDQWRRLRKAMAPALKPQRFMSPNVVQKVERSIANMVASIEQTLNKPATTTTTTNNNNNKPSEFDVDDLAHRFSLDVVMSCLYKQTDSVNFNLDQRDPLSHTVDIGLETMAKSSMFKLAMMVPALRRLLDVLSYQFLVAGKWRRDVMRMIGEQAKIGMEARRRLLELRKSGLRDLDEDNFVLEDGTKFNRGLMDHIIDQFHMGKMTKSEYFNSSLFLFTAADKTLSDAIAYTLYQLAKNPKIQTKLRTETRLKGDQSEYLQWVINESLRLCPPVSGGCTRTISEDTKANNGDILPAGTCVLTPMYAIHRLKQYWGEDADEFSPDRWAKADTFHPCQFMPFGAGLRTCMGKDFALFQLRMVLRTLLDRYHFEVDANYNPKAIEFTSPIFLYLLHDDPILLKISRLHDEA